jgi:hypothetical protein
MAITLPSDGAAAYTYTQPIRDGITRANELTDDADGTSPKRIPVGVLATGTPTGAKFLRDDRTWQSPPGGTATETVHTIAVSGSSQTLNPTVTGTYKRVTLTANCTFTFAGATAGQVTRMDVELIENGTGGWTTTWPTVKWVGGAPTPVTTANAVNVFTFWSSDGTTWFGAAVGLGFA